MAKIIWLVAILVVIGCQRNVKKKNYQELQAQGYDLVLGSDYLSLQFNLQNDSLKARQRFSEYIYKDTMHLSDSEKDEIASSFFEQNINECRGDIEIFGKNFSSSEFSDEIYLYKYKQKIATFSVVKNYEPEGLFADGKAKKIVEFRDAVWKILSKKTKYRIADDSVTSVLRKGPLILM